MKIDPKVESILEEALSGTDISREEALELLKIDNNSPEIYALMSTADTLTIRQSGRGGEVYAQLGIITYGHVQKVVPSVPLVRSGNCSRIASSSV